MTSLLQLHGHLLCVRDSLLVENSCPFSSKRDVFSSNALSVSETEQSPLLFQLKQEK